jgi:predicted ATPase
VSATRHPPYLRSIALVDTAPDHGYPYDLPAVRGLAIDLAPVTVLVGDNGSGKSTIVEAIAVAAGFNAEGGSRNLRFETLATHSELRKYLRLTWKQRPHWGWFLRAETFYGMASHITLDRDHGVAEMFPDLHSRSHGQSFLTLIEDRFSSPGIYIMDEPESALSFEGQLKLLRFMHDGVAAGAQFIVATHSPMLMRAEGSWVRQRSMPRMRPLVGTPVPAVTSTCSTSSTWLTLVPRT